MITLSQLSKSGGSPDPPSFFLLNFFYCRSSLSARLSVTDLFLPLPFFVVVYFALDFSHVSCVFDIFVDRSSADLKMASNIFR